MDKRYFLILIILIVSLANMYVIANFSDEIGTASVSVDKYIFSIPAGFNLLDSTDKYVVIGHNDDDFRIYVYVDNNNNYTYRFNQINSSSDYKVYSSGIININDVIVHSMYYEYTYDKAKPPINQSLFYFDKEGCTFRVLMAGFNYGSDRNSTIDDITYIVNSLRLDYKK